MLNSLLKSTHVELRSTLWQAAQGTGGKVSLFGCRQPFHANMSDG